MKFGEGYVFTGLCLFTEGGVGSQMHHGIGHMARYPTPHPPHIPYSPCYWHLVVITIDLFKLVHLGMFPSPHPTSTDI